MQFFTTLFKNKFVQFILIVIVLTTHLFKGLYSYIELNSIFLLKFLLKPVECSGTDSNKNDKMSNLGTSSSLANSDISNDTTIHSNFSNSISSNINKFPTEIKI